MFCGMVSSMSAKEGLAIARGVAGARIPSRPNDDGEFAVFGRGLRRAPCDLDDLAEAVLGVLY